MNQLLFKAIIFEEYDDLSSPTLITKIEEAFNKRVDAFEKTEIIKNSKIDKEIQKTGVVVYEK